MVATDDRGSGESFWTFACYIQRKTMDIKGAVNGRCGCSFLRGKVLPFEAFPP